MGWTETTEWKWTPLFLAHSPRYGYTEGQALWQYKIRIVIQPGGLESTLEQSVTLMPQDGQCVGRFQLCLWLHERYMSWERFSIKQTSSYYLVYNLYDGNTDTCGDDIEEFNHSNYRSIEFRSRYSTCERIEDNPSDSWYAVTMSVGTGLLIVKDLTVAVSIFGIVTVGTGVFSLENKATETWTYKYWFGPKHMWYVDYIGATNTAWAFKLVKNY